MKNTTVKNTTDSVQILLFMLVFAGILIYHMKNNYGNYAYYTNYMYDYRIGFVSKALVGSIISLFSGKIISIAAVAGFSFYSGLITNISLLFLLFYALSKCKPVYRTYFFVVLILFLVSPVLYNYYMTLAYGWLDVLWFLSFFLSILFLKGKYSSFFIALFCILAISAHSAFCFLVFPSVFALQYYEASKNGFNKVRIYALTLNAVVSVLLSVYYTLFATTKMTLEELLSYVESKSVFGSDYLFWTEHWTVYYYMHVNQAPITDVSTIQQYLTPLYPSASQILKTFLPVVLFIAFFLTIWLFAFIKSSKTSEKFLFLGLLLLPVFTSIIFIVAVDYGRWVSAYTCSQFIVFFYLLHDSDSVVSKMILPNKIIRRCTLLGLFVAFLVSQHYGANLP